MVSNGCSAALTLAAAACVAGGNPDLHVRLPNLAGFPKDEAIIPTHSRNVYDAALRSVGLRVVEVSTLAEFEAALGPRVAMIYILAGPNADNSPLNVKAIAPIAKARGIPILVDAAAEILTIPNVHLQNGATLVAYSGGKCLRGSADRGSAARPQGSGPRRLGAQRAAPRRRRARLKVGKEDAIGMLMAVEMWVKRDHDAEWKRWTGWLDHISQRVSPIAGVTTTVVAADRAVEPHARHCGSMWDRQTARHQRRAGRAAAVRGRTADHARCGARPASPNRPAFPSRRT